MRRASLLTACLLVCEGAAAGSLLDYIRDYDLNDYALGVAFSATQNPYAGASSSAIAYPYLSSFKDSTMTDDWFLVRDGDLGARWVSENGWEIGAVGRINTLGLGNHDSDELRGIHDRKWTAEVGPTVGWRGWPVHIYLKSYADVSNRHDGLLSQLSLAWPMQWSRGFLVPSVDLIHQSSDYAGYYYSVTGAEATPSRAAYTPDAATNIGINARWGYALTDKWLLTGSAGLEFLDSTISASPIVDEEQLWSANIGLAYNADLFRARSYDGAAPRVSNVEIRVAIFQDTVQSSVAKETAEGVPGVEISLEDVLGVSDQETLLQIDASIRVGHYHRFKLGYFELGRHSTTTLLDDVDFGDQLFASGTDIETRVSAKVLQATYSYSLMRDAQKELGVTVGVHFTDVDARVSVLAGGQVERSSVATPLPVLGLHAAIFLGERTALSAEALIFRTDFDHYEGSLNYGALDLRYRLGENMKLGIGYNYYGMKLSSSGNAANGYLKIRHRGPTAFVVLGF